MKKLLALLAFFSLSTLAFAQVGDTGGPITDVETEVVCWSNGGTDSTLYRVWLYVVGQTDPVDLGYRNAAGQSVTVSGGTVKLGACRADAGVPTDYNYSILELCDDGTPFYRLIRYDVNDNGTSIGDYSTTWGSYTVTGSVTAGPCVTSGTATLTRTTSSTTGTIAAGASSFEICNTGTAAASVTVNAVATDLLPGECFSYYASVDPVNRVLRRSPAVTYDATGTTVIIVTAQ